MLTTIANAITLGAQQLAAARVEDACMEAGSLLAHILDRDRTFIIAHDDEPLTDEQMQTFQESVERRARGEPFQYIIGHQEFFKLEFEVTPDVLIPRPETEIVVETAVDLLRDKVRPVIADIGTGSGCIAISMLYQMPEARAVATDVSHAALKVAERNAKRHDVIDRLKLVESDCFSHLEAAEQFDLIASNPPYVAEHELKTIQREVRYEPHAALFAGPDGLAVVRRLLSEAPLFLCPGGYFVFEIGYDQSEAVKQLINPRMWEFLEIREDLQRLPRTVVLQNRER